MAYLKSVEDQNKKRETAAIKYQTKKNWIHKHIYNTTRWRKDRLSYLSEHPLCEHCLQEGLIIPATLVHHKQEISSGMNDEAMKNIAFDINNLQALCNICHKEIHNKQIDYFLFDD